jgi:hypothetical protein
MSKAGSEVHVPPAVIQAASLLGMLYKKLSTTKAKERSGIEGVNLRSSSSSNLAIVLGFDILTFSLIELAVVQCGHQNGNILPWRWVPYKGVITEEGIRKGG